MAWSLIGTIADTPEIRCMAQVPSGGSLLYLGTYPGGLDGDIYKTADVSTFTLDQSISGVRPWCMEQFGNALFCGMRYVTGTHKAEVWRKDSDASAWVLDGELETDSDYKSQVYQMWATGTYLYAVVGVNIGAASDEYWGDAKVYRRDTSGNWTFYFEPTVPAESNKHQAAVGICYKDGYIYVRAHGAWDAGTYTAIYRYNVSTDVIARVWKTNTTMRWGTMCAGHDKIVTAYAAIPVGSIYKWNGSTFVLDKAAVADYDVMSFNDWIYVVCQDGNSNHLVYRWDQFQWHEEPVYYSPLSNLYCLGTFRDQPYAGSTHGRVYGPDTEWETYWIVGRGKTANCLDVDTEDASLVRVGAHSGSTFLPVALEITAALDHCHAVYQGSSGSVMGIRTEYGDNQEVYFFGSIDGSPIWRAEDGITFESSGSEFVSQMCRNVLVAQSASGSPLALTSGAQVWESAAYNQWHLHGALSFDPLGAARYPGYFFCAGRFATGGSPMVEMSWDTGASREQRDTYLPSGVFVSDVSIYK